MHIAARKLHVHVSCETESCVRLVALAGPAVRRVLACRCRVPRGTAPV